MTHKLLATAAALTMIGAVLPPAPAARAQPADLVIVDLMPVEQGYRASALMGREVRNDKGDRIGTIDDLVIGRAEPRVLYAVLQVGGFLGLGAHLVAVPYASLKFDQNGKITLPGASREALQHLPEFVYRAG